MNANPNTLVKRKVTVHGKNGDYQAFRNTKANEDVRTPREKKIDQARHDRNKVSYRFEKSKEELQKEKEISERHLKFESEAKEQRRAYGSGPKLPKPGMIMRVYAKGRANVGGMLAKIKEVASDGKSVVCELTSGMTHTLPIEHVEFAKSFLVSDESKNYTFKE
ncbi:hypothetical protein EHQ76_07450 [Leptospira barantonii]|uniref:Uncharacterized protein n=1 Tax=Leptospira barantonii TaxID=2023184 RepID=A0A5F2BL37_9LEPT|nr:hypothetical protein [Leptospira barantonii]TGM04870.1 hypothetical protein EHQ76_07450 [Leptospira barantonii]